jgi:hypothetical protein
MPSPEPDLVALTRASMEATNRHEFDAAVGVFATQVVFDMEAAGLGRFEGIAAARRYLEDWIGSHDSQRFARWEGADVGNGVVLVEALLDARPAGAAASLRELWAFVVVWDGGRIVSITADKDLERARARAQRAASGG